MSGRSLLVSLRARRLLRGEKRSGNGRGPTSILVLRPRDFRRAVCQLLVARGVPFFLRGEKCKMSRHPFDMAPHPLGARFFPSSEKLRASRAPRPFDRRASLGREGFQSDRSHARVAVGKGNTFAFSSVSGGDMMELCAGGGPEELGPLVVVASMVCGSADRFLWSSDRFGRFGSAVSARLSDQPIGSSGFRPGFRFSRFGSANRFRWRCCRHGFRFSARKDCFFGLCWWRASRCQRNEDFGFGMESHVACVRLES